MSHYVSPAKFIALIKQSQEAGELQPALYTVIKHITVGICKLYNYKGIDWEDVCQDAALEVHRSLQSIKLDLNPFAYVTQIVKTMAAKELRRRRAEHRVATDYGNWLGNDVGKAGNNYIKP